MARVFVITGPSGVGKGSLIAALRDLQPELQLSISATTRAARDDEEDAVAYYFLSDAEFDRRLDAGEFIEHASYAGHRYGTLRGELDRRTNRGAAVVLEIDVQGARQVREAVPGAVLVFIAPPSLEVLRERLQFRGTEDQETIAERLVVAETELAARDEFPHVIVNDHFDDAVRQLEALYLGELEQE
jgi:guanylate kinase